ncbi:MAG: ribulose phosphate epimerase [Myxococcales bacterium]|nr:ribulose phosphate epimerase [Myxococcales bacterium]
MPYADNGGNAWNALKCVPVMEDPAGVGEACFVVDSAVSGIDNCGFGAMCWDVDEENMGTCVAMCTGTPDSPMCESGFVCPVYGEGVINICLPTCHPLEQDCPGGELCINYLDGFMCVFDASGDEGQAHDACEFANSCDVGLVCSYTEGAADECDPAASGCCEPYCDVTLANTCPGAGQVCTPWFEPGDAPEGLENVGLCSLPG